MSEKIDLAKISATASTMPEHWIVPQQMLALIRIARAALAYARSGHVADRLALQAALEPITDSSDSAEGSDD